MSQAINVAMVFQQLQGSRQLPLLLDAGLPSGTSRLSALVCSGKAVA